MEDFEETAEDCLSKLLNPISVFPSVDEEKVPLFPTSLSTTPCSDSPASGLLSPASNKNDTSLPSSSVIPTSSSAIVPVPSEGLSITPSLPPELSQINVQNLIASVYLCVRIDLRSLVISIRNAEYNPRKVNAVVVRYRSPRCTALVFHSGRMMITGAAGDEEAKEAARKIAKLIQMVTKVEGMKFRGFKVENLIASADCGVPVRLEDLAKDHKDFCCYEPELFSGLVYRYNPCSSPVSAVLLIFVSGKIIITGCKKKSDAESVFDSIYPVVMQYQT
eukprot:GHVS01007435.1.p1 GENE.GHVS01007435.1~~GHVS01007435.1.p1  ORF type:complete len:286 (+),score=40.38 GHVS01007435.1:29-859(+)